MNLEVYLDTTTELVSSLAEALSLLKSKKYDLIVTLSKIENVDSAKQIGTYLSSSKTKTPVIVTGTVSDGILGENQFGLAGKFDIQSILKTSAKILGITAQQMAKLNVGEFYHISSSLLKGVSKAPCSLYIKAGNLYKAVVHTEDDTEEFLKNLESMQINSIYVKSNDRLTLINKLSLKIMDKITKNLLAVDSASVNKKVDALNNGYEFAAANLFSNAEIKEQMQEIASASAKVMQDVSREASSLKSLLAIMESNSDGYIFTHSLVASYVTYHMLKNATWGGENMVEKINFVLFFHDLYLAPLYLKYPELRLESELLLNDKLTSTEKDTVLNHAKLAAEVVATYKRCPIGADVLIMQHHGMKKGVGFAKLYMEDLSPISKMIMIAEMFVEEFMITREKEQKFNSREVISKISNEFKTPSYAKMAMSLLNVPL